MIGTTAVVRNRAERHLAFAALLVALVLSATPARGQGGMGQIYGTVTDPQGGIVRDVSLTLRNEESGVTRSTVTSADGRYRFPAIDPGRYMLIVERAGFARVETGGIDITIGLDLRRDFSLSVEAFAQDIVVTGAAPAIDTTTAETGGIVTEQQIEMLPINSRQYLSLALLMPGTSLDATRPIGPNVNVGASMTFNSSGNVVDGVINSWAEDGEPRQSLPQDAVEEFRVSHAQYPAEFGLATGGIIQIATKAGSNQYRGSLFDYFRNKALSAKGYFEDEEPEFRRHQFGGSLGGPIRRDRIHFFAAAERTAVDEFYTVNTGLPQFYAALEGTFAKPSHRNLYFGRLDWQPGGSQSVFVRYAREDERATCVACGGSSASGLDQDLPRRTFVAGHTWRGTRALNDFRFQYAGAAYYVGPSGTKVFKRVGEFPPERTNRLARTLTFPSATWGTNFDESAREARWQFKDTYAFNVSRHELRVGADISYMPYVAGNAGSIGTYIFGEDQFLDPGDPASLGALTGATLFTATVPSFTAEHPTRYAVAFVQDEWRLRSNVTLNLGLRYERYYGAANEDLDPSIFPIEIPYIDVDSRGDRNNVGPRIGVAWDGGGDGRTVVRGGYGLHYGHVRIIGNLGEFANYQQSQIFIVNPAYPDPYGGRNPRDFARADPASLTVVANDYVQPYSHQFNAGISRRLWFDLTLHVDALVTNVNHDRKSLDINPPDPQTGQRPDPTFGEVMQLQSTAFVRYRALYTRLDKSFSHRSRATASYTYTRSRDNNPEGRYINPFDPSDDDGPSNAERRHAFVAGGSVLLPWQVTVGAIWTLRSLLPWTARPGRDVNLDGAFNDLVPGTTRNSGGRNLNLEAVNAWRVSNARPPVAASQLESSRVNIVDARVSKSIRLRRTRIEVVGQVFNLFDTVNLGAQYEGGRVANALSPSFGRILTARPGRQGEVAIKLIW
jgi:hypothetical protein